ncbi:MULTISPECIES: sulfate adenylyltransferase [Bacillaceae]|uniref:sulfate adenylyltransferase n=1 Tax=Bacillaceae TaxID=186817 RepID=UPI001C564796|nr:sulfate adenylyltransferase [Rossellomorea sp. YZS02]MBW3113783.1 sulfate adenylyltransferase [Bacillus sp. MCCB 382]MDX8343974.1 sulfate adenylyltransferase [Rossellomorea sp. YZS02]
MVSPHGGTLVNRVAEGESRTKLLEKAESFFSITLDAWSLSDLVLISIGAFSPLNGFMKQKDYLQVLKEMRLSTGEIWSLPITLSVSQETKEKLSIGQVISLKGEDDVTYGVMEIEEIYQYSKKAEALFVYKTADSSHPGVSKVFEKEDYYVAGPVTLLNKPESIFTKDFQTPKQLRKTFQSLGWRTIVAFQTRNPIHRAHEYLQKTALENVDGLLIHPLVGNTKADDIPPDIRMKSYKVLIENYYPKDRALLSVFPAAMRYAGPREAVFHSIVRKNFGCTHFIVGRDHAGVGNYYGTYEAQNIFDQFNKEELEIEILKFEHAFYCIKCASMATAKTCPHDNEFHIHLSGTKVRDMLRNGQVPPKEFSRPEVIEVLLAEMEDKQV